LAAQCSKPRSLPLIRAAALVPVQFQLSPAEPLARSSSLAGASRQGEGSAAASAQPSAQQQWRRRQ